MHRHAFGEGFAAITLVAGMSLAAPGVSAEPPWSGAEQSGVEQTVVGQTLEVSENVKAVEHYRGTIDASPAAEVFAANGTNRDWAKLVLLFGGWPITEENTTVILRWMRQENGVDNWFNRNNPLNNGYGSGGGSGLGSYDTLSTAALKAAENLKRGSGYVDIVAALERGDSADAVARAIWASPWASSHYANGTHWSTRPVPVIRAPESAWE
jgi:hypothetical protein